MSIVNLQQRLNKTSNIVSLQFVKRFTSLLTRYKFLEFSLSLDFSPLFAWYLIDLCG